MRAGAANYSPLELSLMFAVESLLVGEVAPFMSFASTSAYVTVAVVLFRRRIILSLARR